MQDILKGQVKANRYSTATAFVIRFPLRGRALKKLEAPSSDLTSKMLPFLPEKTHKNTTKAL